MSVLDQTGATAATGGEAILLREDAGGVCTLTLNRPDHYNALSETMLAALQDALDAIADDPSVRVVVLAARGKAFCAGHDLKEMRARPEQAYYEALFKTCSLVATCDLAVASNTAELGTSGINVGLFCMTPGVALARKVKRKDAFELLFTGDIIPAERACELGLINRVVAPERLDGAIAELSQSIIAKSQAAVSAGKRVFYQQLELGLEAAYELASVEMARNMMFHDAGEGIDAFIGKRKPVWTHE
jgi:enoyl-CoA hydratase/carnithine racemase